MVAGTSLILPVFNITLCFAGLAGIGGGSLISRLLGQSKTQEARRVSAFSLYLAIFIAALFSILKLIFIISVFREYWYFLHTVSKISMKKICDMLNFSQRGDPETVLSINERRDQSGLGAHHKSEIMITIASFCKK